MPSRCRVESAQANAKAATHRIVRLMHISLKPCRAASAGCTVGGCEGLDPLLQLLDPCKIRVSHASVFHVLVGRMDGTAVIHGAGHRAHRPGPRPVRSVTIDGVIALKLAGVALVVAAATVLARRHGHRAGGLVGGLPLVAGPVSGALLLSNPVGWVRDVAVLTLACLPATLLHALVFARAARRHGTLACLVAANGAFAVTAAMLDALSPPGVVAGVTALAALWGVRRLLPSAAGGVPSAVAAPAGDLLWRVGSAVALAAALLVLSESASPAVAGWLLALPITGNVLPAFAQARQGPDATVAVVHGFVSGLGAFLGFFAALAIGLTAVVSQGAGGAWIAVAWVASVFAAPAVGWVVARWVGRSG